MKNVIVTGANGFLGSSLILKLMENGIHAVAIDISFENSRLPQSGYITKIEMELDGIAELSQAIPKNEYDAFYHFAWQGVNGAEKADPIVQLHNAQMAVNCAATAKSIGCRKFLCAGTIAEQAVHSLSRLERTNGGMMYGIAKHCAHLMLETYCKNIGLDFVWMQFSNIYGAQNKTGNLISYTLGEILSNREATFGPAEQPYDFIYIEDLLEAVYRLGEMDTRRNCYYIGSGEPRILKDYLLEVGAAAGKKELIKIGVRPDDGIVYRWDMFDISSLKNDIGNYVTGSFRERIKDTVASYIR